MTSGKDNKPSLHSNHGKPSSTEELLIKLLEAMTAQSQLLTSQNDLLVTIVNQNNELLEKLENQVDEDSPLKTRNLDDDS